MYVLGIHIRGWILREVYQLPDRSMALSTLPDWSMALSTLPSWSMAALSMLLRSMESGTQHDQVGPGGCSLPDQAGHLDDHMARSFRRLRLCGGCERGRDRFMTLRSWF